MANQFQHISGVAVKVLARLAARKAVKEQLRQQGVRGVVSHREIVRASNAYLAANPRLYEEALATAWAMAAKDQQGRINAVLFDDDRRGFRKPRRPVSGTDNAKTASENAR
jgi:hypothetical protein